MISFVEIYGFQGYADKTRIEFGDITALVGDTDAGKSAILRAIGWVLTNRPLGAKFINRRMKHAEVTVGLEPEGVAVTRYKNRTGSKNFYQITYLKDSSKDADVFEAVGNGAPPAAILEVLKINPDLNIQNQIDPPFLLSKDAGEVSRFINTITGLSEVDDFLAVASRKIFADNTALTRMRKERTAVIEEQKALRPFLNLHRRAQDLLQEQKALEVLTRRADNLANNIDEINSQTESLADAEKIADLSSGITSVDRVYRELLRAKHDRKALDMLITDVHGVMERVTLAEEQLLEAQHALVDAVPHICPFCGRPMPEGFEA